MDVKQFWAIIDEAREEAGGLEEMLSPLVKLLSQFDISEIMTWKQIFDEYQNLSYKNKLWAAAYVINGGCSDDGFDYFRAWLTAQGEEVFLAALKGPDSLAKVGACEEGAAFEDMLSVACEAYFKKTGISRDYDKFYEALAQYHLAEAVKSDIAAKIQYAADIDIEWDGDDEDALKTLLPKLCEAFDW